MCPGVCVQVKTWRKYRVDKNRLKAFITDRTTRDFSTQGGRRDSLGEHLAPQRKFSGLGRLALGMPTLSKCYNIVKA